MKRITQFVLILLYLAIILAVFLFFASRTAISDKPATDPGPIQSQQAQPVKAGEITPQAAYLEQPAGKDALKSILGVSAQRDFYILEAIIQCESGWQHFRPGGEVKVSSGNVGYAQINKIHLPRFIKLGLDIYKPYDNLKAAVILYDEQGIGPWQQWSGHCFIPLLKQKGIEF